MQNEKKIWDLHVYRVYIYCIPTYRVYQLYDDIVQMCECGIHTL